MAVVSRGALKTAILGPALILIMAASAVELESRAGPDVPDPACMETLRRVREEIREVAEYAGEGFIKWECFIGGPDDDDTNKDQHVVIMIRRLESVERMTVSITALERSRRDPKIKYARGTKTIACDLADGTARLVSADYDAPASDEIAAAVLRAVLDKKRLLRER
jgi:hypothetical protein